MGGSISGSFALDGTIWSLGLIILLGCLGFVRGVRAEGITLAGVIAASVVLSTDPLREKIVGIVNKLPRIVNMLLGAEDTAAAMSGHKSLLLSSPDQKLVFYAIFFIAGVALFYIAGSAWGGGAISKIQRLAGLVMGALGGYVISISLTGFSQDYVSRHPDFGQTEIRLPSIITPTMPQGNALSQYMPLVFLMAFFLVAFLALASVLKARRQ